MRSTVKRNIVMQAMQGGSAFAQGRMLGQAETEIRWQAKDMGRRTRQAVRDANEKLTRERENDWSKCNEDELQAKLVERGVICVNDKNKTGKEKQAEPVLPTYTNGMVKLSFQCIANEERRLKQAEEEYDAESDEKGEPVAT
jgi:predicted phage gp36 major capsid-like protein